MAAAIGGGRSTRSQRFTSAEIGSLIFRCISSIPTSISAAAPSRPVSPALIEWMDTHSALFLSAVTVAEIEDGIAKSRREGAARKSADLSAWLETVLHLYGNRVLAFDVATARIAGAISDRARGLGQTPGFGGHHYRRYGAASWADNIVTQPQAFRAPWRRRHRPFTRDCRMREQRGWRSMTDEGRAFTRKRAAFCSNKQPVGQNQCPASIRKIFRFAVW